MSEAYRILLVDDEEDILNFLSYNLKKEGYEVYTALNGHDGIELATKHKPHLIVLDVMMPEMDGIETCRIIRENKEIGNTLIVFLSARSEDYTQIAGFDSGADDYITKPVKPRVFISRIKALLRRLGSDTPKTEKVMEFGDIKVDLEKYMVYKNQNEIILPKKEFKLLELLVSKPGKVFTREFILEKIWGDEVVVGDRTIDVHIRKLREKLGEENIKTVKGVGYKFEF
ncbi:MAG TPA: response regulator transcription factor [Bacteroidia bacterium]|nr:response regulator transcription factor [Bacteroidia bacterium]HRD37807.1 response regulator transcription factor [Bacteroidia bacterium]